MSFNVNRYGGYGTGAAGDVTISATNTIINSYAQVTSVTDTTITISSSNQTTISSAPIAVGAEILFHVSDYSSATGAEDDAGLYAVYTITAVNGNVLTIDTTGGKQTPTDIVQTSTVTVSRYPQIVVIPQYKNLIISKGCSITAAAWNSSKKCGGIVAFKCSEYLDVQGGTSSARGGINLLSKGRTPPSGNANTTQYKDTAKYAGWENYETKKRLVLNCGDGALFAIVKNAHFTAWSRIGNLNSDGVQRCRGDVDDSRTPTDYSNVGGSSILLVAENIDSVNNTTYDTSSTLRPNMIAKYRQISSGGSGVARCYIATESLLPNDEGLYALDCVRTPNRLDECNLGNIGFGDGKHGVCSSPTALLNNYAPVVGYNQKRNVLTFYAGKRSTAGATKWVEGNLVMIQVKCGPDATNMQYQHEGRFWLTRIVNLDQAQYQITIDPALPDDFPEYVERKIIPQIITIPEYTSFTLNAENDKTSRYTSLKGGIFAIAVNGTCNLSGGKVNVEGKGAGTYSEFFAPGYGKKGLTFLSNAAMKTRLPVGQGHGSVFILAKEITMDSNTRIGATYTGNAFGGRHHDSNSKIIEGGWLGQEGKQPNTATLKKILAAGSAGSGAAGGFDFSADDNTVSLGHEGGFGGSATHPNVKLTDISKLAEKNGNEYLHGGEQGAHILIVAGKITNLNQAAISTGGGAGRLFVGTDDGTLLYDTSTSSGGCGYGGSAASATTSYDHNFGEYLTGQDEVATGGYMGGGGGTSAKKSAKTDYTYWAQGGGGAGLAFIYANEVVNQDTSGTVRN